jgi:hypothetical protein
MSIQQTGGKRLMLRGTQSKKSKIFSKEIALASLDKKERPVLVNGPQNLDMSGRLISLCAGAGNVMHEPPARSVSKDEVDRG